MIIKKIINKISIVQIFASTVLAVFFSFSSIYSEHTNRIVSLGPYITEDIYLLGAEDQLVGNTVYDVIPETAKKITKVGDIMNINLEKIVSLEPDYVLATGLTSLQNVNRMKKLGLKVIQFSNPADYSQICDQFNTVGFITTKIEKAIVITEVSKKVVNMVTNITANLQKKKVFIELGTKPLFTSSGSTFVENLIEFSGGINICRDYNSGMVSYESVISSNPDVIIITSMGIDGTNEIRNWQKYPGVTAVKNHAVYVIDSYEVGSPTPLTFLIALKDLTLMIHPEISNDINLTNFNFNNLAQGLITNE